MALRRNIGTVAIDVSTLQCDAGGCMDTRLPADQQGATGYGPVQGSGVFTSYTPVPDPVVRSGISLDVVPQPPSNVLPVIPPAPDTGTDPLKGEKTLVLAGLVLLLALGYEQKGYLRTGVYLGGVGYLYWLLKKQNQPAKMPVTE